MVHIVVFTIVSLLSNYSEWFDAFFICQPWTGTPRLLPLSSIPNIINRWTSSESKVAYARCCIPLHCWISAYALIEAIVIYNFTLEDLIVIRPGCRISPLATVSVCQIDLFSTFVDEITRLYMCRIPQPQVRCCS